MDAEVHRAHDCRSTHGAAPDEVVARRCPGERRGARSGGGSAARGWNQPLAVERLPALRARSVGPAVANAARARGSIHRALRRRRGAGLSVRTGRTRDVAVRFFFLARSNLGAPCPELRPLASTWMRECFDAGGRLDAPLRGERSRSVLPPCSRRQGASCSVECRRSLSTKRRVGKPRGNARHALFLVSRPNIVRERCSRLT